MTNKLDGAPPPVKNSSKHSGRSPNVCKKHASASVIDNNGTSSDMLSGSPSHMLALSGETPSSPRASVKRRGLFFCCTGRKKTGNNRKRMSSSSQAAANMQQHQEQAATARIHIKHETQEHLMQVNTFFLLKLLKSRTNFGLRISVSGMLWSVSCLTGNNRKRHQEQVATSCIHIKHETQEHLMQVDAFFLLKLGHTN